MEERPAGASFKVGGIGEMIASPYEWYEDWVRGRGVRTLGLGWGSVGGDIFSWRCRSKCDALWNTHNYAEYGRI